jgi:hypothetical protein
MTLQMMLGMRSLQATTMLPGSEVLWVIPNMAANLAEANRGAETEVVSDRYALGPFGYQFQLVAEFTKKKGFVLLCGTQPGPYDDALQWPFNRTFTMSLLSRSGGHDRSNGPFQMPELASSYQFNRDTVGYVGDTESVSLSELQEGGYIKNDSLLVKVAFEAPAEATVLTGSEAIWTIPGVAAHMAAWHKDVTSGRFALGAFGYHFRLKADFDGSALLLACGTQPGPHDDVLEWPFNRSFKLTVLGRERLSGSSSDYHCMMGSDCHCMTGSMPGDAKEGGLFSPGSFYQGEHGFVSGSGYVPSHESLTAGGYIHNDFLLVKVEFQELIQEVTVLTGPEAIWVIPDVFNLCENEGTVSSGMYALGQFGYRFQLKAEFDKDTGLLVYCGTQPGPYDNVLQWPFNRSYAVDLLGADRSDDEPGVVGLSGCVHMPAGAGNGCFEKGTSGLKMAAVLNDLGELQTSPHGFVQNNALTVKIIFDVPTVDPVDGDSDSDND